MALIAASSHANDPVADGQWFHAFLRSSEALKLARGAGVSVALIDTGIDRHPDLTGAAFPGIDITDSTGDGRTDLSGHGTAMAGLIAANGRVNGIAPKARIIAIRVRQSDGLGSTAAMTQGIAWAVAQGVDVVSLSGATSADDLLLRQEIQRALNDDIVVVAGVGNLPQHDRVAFPAAIQGVVAVAGVDRNGNHSAISVTGPEVVIAAPSDAISSTGLNGGYWEGTGTSIATAIVAGAVALIRSRFPDMKAPEVIRRLTATAVDKGAPGRDPEYGYGVLNIVGALTADLPPLTATASATPTHSSAGPPAQGGRQWWRVVGLAAVAAIVGLLARLWWRRRIGAA